MSSWRRVVALAVAVAALAVSSRATLAADVVCVVSAKSTVASLSKSQIADLFLGRANRFPSGEAAVPIDQPEGSPVRDSFYQEFAGKTPAQVKAHWAKIIFTGRGQPPPSAVDSAEVRKRVASDPAAIGYIDSKAVDSTVRVLAPP